MRLGLAAGLSIAIGCTEAAPTTEPARAGARAVSFASLRVEEGALRAVTDFTTPRDAGALGPDPYDLAALPGGGFVGLSRAAGTLVALDPGGRPRGEPIGSGPRPRSVAASDDGRVLVAGDRDAILRAFALEGGALVRRAEDDVHLALETSIRAVAFGPGGCIYAVAEREDLLVTACGAEQRRVRTPAGPFAVRIENNTVIVAASIGHALAAAPLDASGWPAGELVSITQDAPFFGIAAVGRGSGVLVAAGGVEDAPLDRTGGFFGNVDSFVWLFEFHGGAWQRLSAVNTGELGVVTPKALALEIAGGEAVTVATGYASESAVTIRTPLAGEGNAGVEVFPSAPGLTEIARGKDGRLCGASPLLDAWITLRPGSDPHIEPAHGAHRADLFLGEALFYTSLMGPWQDTAEKKSRFTCETCHFEGGVDGRTHRTGRGEVLATTKPLRGIFNNAPHFTRALDEDTTEMVFAEFDVAAAASPHDGWFSLDEVPMRWPRAIAWAPDVDRSALGLRRALLGYLAYATHGPNPRVRGRAAFSPAEARGADLFEARCSACHAARLVAADPASAVAKADWERLVFSEAGPIVWARAGYEKTGVEPYVHAEGARPTSLRRLEDKRPYFTNGSAKTLDHVLERARWEGERFFHDRGPPGAQGLTDEERASLRAFLLLL